ncbi:MAG: SnoaL-like domain-containing protein [Rhodospirillales bacterium]|nr:SnoaL-like domain-containing protein [Rhodospirillales bacterium]
MVACFALGRVDLQSCPTTLLAWDGSRRSRAWLATWEGPIEFEAADDDLVVDGGIAMMTSLQRMRGTKTHGEKVDFWFRVTTCFQKRDGTWKITHDHSSTPFHMDGSYRAAVDLQPEGRLA